MRTTAVGGECTASSPSSRAAGPRGLSTGNATRSEPVETSQALHAVSRQEGSRDGSACACPDPWCRQMLAIRIASQREPSLSLRQPVSGRVFESSCSKRPTKKSPATEDVGGFHGRAETIMLYKRTYRGISLTWIEWSLTWVSGSKDLTRR